MSSFHGFRRFARRWARAGLVRGTLLLSCLGVALSAVSLSAAPSAPDGDVSPALSGPASFFPAGEVEEPLPPASLPPPDPGDPRLIEVQRSYGFVWPASGHLTSYFNADHPTGIDIALSHDVESPILSSGGGKVTFAGGDECC